MDERTLTVRGCARCGETHEVTFRQFGRPIDVRADEMPWRWWGICPTTSEPVLMREPGQR